jgi:DMSO/TMAO reductase YedYZ molybdopterin-dependent catalytic subunit
VTGAVARPLSLSFTDLVPTDDLEAVLDCTGGWYAHRHWQGVALGALLARAGPLPGARSVVVRSVTGYARRFPLREAERTLLATHVDGEPLSHGHGAPLRLVAPGRRGYEWVKWVEGVEVSRRSPLWRWPLPPR